MALMDFLVSAVLPRGNPVGDHVCHDNELAILEAINAHVRWKQRLARYIDGKGQDALDPDHICRDDHCTLGRWLHGAGKARLGSHPSFDPLRARHAEFHRCAARVVALARAGNRAEADELLHGEYAHLSRDLVSRLLQLNHGLLGRSGSEFSFHRGSRHP